MRFTHAITAASLLLMTLTLACGGGGGGTSTPPPPAPVISSFTAAQGSISQGGSTTLTGVFTNGTGSINNGVGSVQSGVAISTGALQATTTFTLSVTGSGGSASATTTVTVIPKTIADTLAYTDPSGTGFRLVRNASLSTASKLVLDLTGPAGTGQGVAFIVSADQTKVTWSNPPASGTLAANVAFTLGSGTQALVGKATGDQLQGAAFQKPGAAAVNLAQPLMRISLDLKSNIPVNTSVPISFTAGNQLPASGSPSTITVAVGTLLAQ